MFSWYTLVSTQSLTYSRFYQIHPHIISFVSGAHKRRENAYLQILVKDRGLMGQGIFLGEAYLPLCEVSIFFDATSSILINSFPVKIWIKPKKYNFECLIVYIVQQVWFYY